MGREMRLRSDSTARGAVTGPALDGVAANTLGTAPVQLFRNFTFELTENEKARASEAGTRYQCQFTRKQSQLVRLHL
jgi:hypothetical protein